MPPSRLPKWGALNVSARTDHSLLQQSLQGKHDPQQKWHGNGKSDACYRLVRVGLARAGGDEACQTPRQRPLLVGPQLGTQGLSQGGYFLLFLLTLAI